MATIRGPIDAFTALFEDDNSHTGSDIISVLERIFATHAKGSNVTECNDVVPWSDNFGTKRKHGCWPDDAKDFKQRRLEPSVSPVSTMPSSHQTREAAAIRSILHDTQGSELPAQILSGEDEEDQKGKDSLECQQQNSASQCSQTEHGSVTEERSKQDECEPQRDLVQIALYTSYLESVLKSPFSTTNGEQCAFCPERLFFRRHDLIRHVKTAHICDRPFHCTVEACNGKFKRKSHLDSHVKAVHERCLSFTCRYCQRVYSSDSTRRKHIRVNHDTTVYD